MTDTYIVSFKEGKMLKPEALICKIVPATVILYYPDNLALFRLKGILLDVFEEITGRVDTVAYRQNGMNVRTGDSLLYIIDEDFIAIFVSPDKEKITKFTNLLRERLKEETEKAMKEGVVVEGKGSM